MKIAVFHDYFGAIGGGERVTLMMAKMLGADVITTDTESAGKLDPEVQIISLGKTWQIPPLKQISATMRFKYCDFSDDYDFFIFTGNWSHAAAEHHHPNLWYCYTPVRAFYDLYPVFLSRQNLLKRQAFRAWVKLHRRIDQKSVSRIDRTIGISQVVQQRIYAYYQIKAKVIPPPVDTTRYHCSGFDDFWLSVNRLYPEKRIEMQIEVFRKLPHEHLIVVGGYAPGDHAAVYARKIMQNLPPNISVLGEVAEEKLIDLYSRCKGHICTAINEDFGLTPLEAMASGKPVLAVNEGGYRETVTEKTGIIAEPFVGSLVEGVKSISQDPSRYYEECRQRAQEFDTTCFLKKFKNAIKEIVSSP